MGIYFGTDGLRGIYGEELTPSIAFKCGNSLSRFCKKKKVVIGKDTRVTSDILTLSVANGLMQNGVDVIDIGLAPTPAVAFLTKALECDYGIVISASHNPPIYNGIKIFDHDGYKIAETTENSIERKFMSQVSEPFFNVGRYNYQPEYVKKYIEKITTNIGKLNGLKIVIDCGNGASSRIVKKIFKNLGANVLVVNNKTDGLSINENSGALHPQNMASIVIKEKADLGIALDGDADRIIACDEHGELIDGDDILFILASFFKSKVDAVVGTTMSNKGLENALNKKGITLLRADVGDKYVIERMKNNNILLGGEPSGHIIVKSFSTTGDGILTGLLLADIIKKTAKPLSKLINYKKYPQININVEVIDKFRILNSEKLTNETLRLQQQFASFGHVLVRASGTENKIRIMCEHKSRLVALRSAQGLEKIVKEISQR